MLYFGDRHAGCCGHDGIEVPRRLPVKEISPLITLPGLNKSEVRSQTAFEDVHPAVEFACFLIFSYHGPVARRREESCDTGASSAHPFRECTLWNQFHLDLTGKCQFFKQFVLTDVCRDDFTDLPRFQEKPRSAAIDPGVITDDGQVFRAFQLQSL